jgi:cytochrome c-type biogenesis protein
MNEVSLLGAFAAGVISFLSPCVLPLVPGYIAIISGRSLEELQSGQDQKLLARALLQSLLFICGFSLVFISLGATATWLGQVLLQKMALLNRIAGLLIVLFGLHMVGLLKIPLLYRDARVHDTAKPATMAGSFVMGLAFAFGWTPCIGPILAGIMAIAATKERVSEGIFLLAVYSLGLAVPFVLTTLGINRFLKFYQRFRKHLHRLEVAAGVLLIVLGGLIATNNFGRISSALSFLNRLAL